MRRVVVTGMGIWSCIGQDLKTVTENLKQGRSGIVFDNERIEYGLQSGLIGNVPYPELKSILPRQYRAIMTGDTMYAYMATREALSQSRISTEDLKKNPIGILFGNDGNSTIMDAIDSSDGLCNSRGIDPLMWIKSATSNVSFILSELFQLKGVCSSVCAACASGAHAIGISKIFVQSGLHDVMIVGGSCEIRKEASVVVNALDALSFRNNDPTHASRPFDKDRDGMVPSGGAAALVLEEYEHAVARGANILAEVVGYGFSSNGIEEISMPSAEGEYIAMKRALDDAGLQPSDIDYVNAHATSTPLGDIEEAKALTRLFVPSIPSSPSSPSSETSPASATRVSTPFISSTKSMTGHENWMAGASEAVYSILMMQNNFVAPNINLEHKIDEAKGLNIVRETIYTPIRTVLSNSSGMGGTNSALVFRKI